MAVGAQVAQGTGIGFGQVVSLLRWLRVRSGSWSCGSPCPCGSVCGCAGSGVGVFYAVLSASAVASVGAQVAQGSGVGLFNSVLAAAVSVGAQVVQNLVLGNGCFMFRCLLSLLLLRWLRVRRVCRVLVFMVMVWLSLLWCGVCRCAGCAEF